MTTGGSRTLNRLEIAENNNHVNESIHMAVNRNEQGCLSESEPTKDDVSARERSATDGLTYVFLPDTEPRSHLHGMVFLLGLMSQETTRPKIRDCRDQVSVP
ncbi:Hypothetical predicted protein [Pelobates cultripes]|uniref:Uncharacterized protein n=1 Tax=Pelobates cultripes TaxID=61616 RepID=A0AAD1VV40_PELCU|nr:Hypothetical predicted protein [Pelobates cultripes]